MPVRVEGWLLLIGPGQARTRTHVTIEGYLTSLWTSDVGGKRTALLDLRRAAKLKPQDVYTLLGAVTLTMQPSKPGKKAAAAAVAAPYVIEVEEDRDRDRWLRLFASAVPDRAVGGALRTRYRSDALVLQLMTEHGGQPDTRRKLGWTDGKRGQSAKPAASKPATSVASALDVARQRRDAGDAAALPDEAAPPGGGGTTAAPAAEKGEARGVAAPAAAAPAPPQPDAPAVAETAPPAAAWAEAAPTADAEAAPPAAALEDGADAADDAAEGLASETGGDSSGGSWFIKDEAGGVEGPLAGAEMKRRYLRGVVRHATLVRWLPTVELHEADAADNAELPFAPLQELCSARGPPFAECSI